MNDYDLRCPDCHEDGGSGPRCLEHQDAWLDMEIVNLMLEKEKVEQELKNELPSNRAG